jgi:hypothetical protein
MILSFAGPPRSSTPASAPSSATALKQPETSSTDNDNEIVCQLLYSVFESPQLGLQTNIAMAVVLNRSVIHDASFLSTRWIRWSMHTRWRLPLWSIHRGRDEVEMSAK